VPRKDYIIHDAGRIIFESAFICYDPASVVTDSALIVIIIEQARGNVLATAKISRTSSLVIAVVFRV
jgi:hypothetical protein